MKTVNDTITGNTTNYPLHKLVDGVINDLSHLQTANQIRVVNEVPSYLVITAKDDTLIEVIKGLLHAVMSNATEGEIHISAKELFGNTINVFVKDNNCYNTYAVACALQKIVPLAEKMDGFLNIMNQRQKITTIEFSFPFAKEAPVPGDEE